MSMGYWPPLPRSNRVGSLIGNDHAKSQGTICTNSTLVGNQRVVNTIIIEGACPRVLVTPDVTLALLPQMPFPNALSTTAGQGAHIQQSNARSHANCNQAYKPDTGSARTRHACRQQQQQQSTGVSSEHNSLNNVSSSAHTAGATAQALNPSSTCNLRPKPGGAPS
jgi:hypothetical protein